MKEVTPEFIGMVIIAVMQLGQFWFAIAKHKRAEEGVKKAEMLELKEEVEKKLKRIEAELKSVESRLDKKVDIAREETREDLNKIYTKLEQSITGMASMQATLEHLEQRSLRMESKIDAVKK